MLHPSDDPKSTGRGETQKLQRINIQDLAKFGFCNFSVHAAVTTSNRCCRWWDEGASKNGSSSHAPAWGPCLSEECWRGCLPCPAPRWDFQTLTGCPSWWSCCSLPPSVSKKHQHLALSAGQAPKSVVASQLKAGSEVPGWQRKPSTAPGSEQSKRVRTFGAPEYDWAFELCSEVSIAPISSHCSVLALRLTGRVESAQHNILCQTHIITSTRSKRHTVLKMPRSPGGDLRERAGDLPCFVAKAVSSSCRCATVDHKSGSK